MTTPPQQVRANWRYASEFVSHWFHNIIGFDARALLHPPQYCYGGRAAPVVGRSARKP